jgi:mono/diheme cytochrome c family protein
VISRRVIPVAVVLVWLLPIHVMADEAAGPRSIWSGTYTTAQASRGAEVYPGPCGRCHGRRLDGAPDDPDMFPTRPIAGAKFLREWDGRSLAALLEYLRATMPENNPGYLSDREYVDLIAHMLARSGVPAGRSELEPDPAMLSAILIRRQP